MLTQDITTPLLLILVLLINIGGLGILGWQFLKRNEEITKCPTCHKLDGGRIDHEELLGRFPKAVPVYLKLGRGGKSYKLVKHEKYKQYYKCKYCGQEWNSTIIRRA